LRIASLRKKHLEKTLLMEKTFKEMSLPAKTVKRGISKAELVRLNDTMQEIMRGDGPKPIAVIDEGILVPIRKKSRKRARRATSLMRETGVQTKETLDRAIQAIL
jgi:hypothetical protein